MRGRRALALCVLAATALAACTSSSSRPGGPTPTSPSVAGPSSTSTSAAGSTAAAPARPSGGDWPTYHGTPDRHGVSTSMPAVRGTPSVVAALKLDGQVYAAPVVSAGITVVATERDTVYGLDSAYRQVWRQHIGTASPASERPCGNVDPRGITGTPTIAGGVVYVAAELTAPVRHELVALDLRTGNVLWRKGIDLPGVETVAMQERGALAVSGGRVWVPFGGLAGDCGGYKGRLVGVSTGGAHDAIAYTVPTTREAGIWTPPGPSIDKSGNLFVAVGNGESGVGGKYDYSDSVLKVGTNATLLDSFSPRTWPTDNDADLDLGSQGPALVGPWVFSAGKSGTGYVLRADKLGGVGGEVSQAPVCKSYGGTAVVGSTVYVPCSDGLRAVRISAAGTLSVLWHAGSAVQGSPVVGGGRVWSLDPDAGVLHALDPRTGASREQVRVGATSRFATPALTGRDVLVPTLTGLTVVRTS